MLATNLRLLPDRRASTYTMKPGQRDVLIALFDRESSTRRRPEASGSWTFRDLDDPDRFVWIRGFPTCPPGLWPRGVLQWPVWKAHREAANATMIDSDNVCCFIPRPQSGFRLDGWCALGGEGGAVAGLMWRRRVPKGRHGERFAAFSDEDARRRGCRRPHSRPRRNESSPTRSRAAGT